MSIRLNKSHKEAIAAKARQLSPLNKTLLDAQAKSVLLAEDVRIKSLGGKKIADRYDEVYKHLLEIRETIPDDLATYTIGIEHSNSIYFIMPNSYQSVKQLLPRTAVVSSSVFRLSNANYPEFLEHQLYIRKLREDINKIHDEVYASISSVSTLKKLLEMWPEVIELLPPELINPISTNLPALRTKQLNKLIGLPYSKDKKATN